MTEFCATCGRALLHDWCVWCARFESSHRIDRYEIHRVLGAGAFGQLLLARDTRLGRRVALRTLSPEVADRDAGRTYLKSATAQAGSSHQNCAEIYAVLAAGGQVETPVVVLEFIDGPSLTERAPQSDPSDTVRLMEGVLLGLIHLHALGIAHGRLSPNNILLKGNTAKLTDAGLGEDPESERAFALAAPEVLLGQGASPSADVFTAGAILWWLASRTPPFVANGRRQALLQRQTGPNGQVPEEIEGLLLSTLAYDPAARPSSDVLNTELRNTTDLWLPSWRVPDLAGHEPMAATARRS